MLLGVVLLVIMVLGIMVVDEVILLVIKVLFSIVWDREDIEDGIDDIDLVTLVDIFRGTSDIISGVVIDVVIIVEISNVVFVLDILNIEEDGVCKSEIINTNKLGLNCAKGIMSWNLSSFALHQKFIH